jgi:hypothetical protein
MGHLAAFEIGVGFQTVANVGTARYCPSLLVFSRWSAMIQA